MKRLIMRLATVLAFTGLAACGSSKGTSSSPVEADSTVAIAQMKTGPPLYEVEESPNLLTEYACGKNGKKVEICHVPPGNPAGRRTICIARAAVDSHIQHHAAKDGSVSDFLGKCEGVPVDDDGGGSGSEGPTDPGTGTDSGTGTGTDGGDDSAAGPDTDDDGFYFPEL